MPSRSVFSAVPKRPIRAAAALGAASLLAALAAAPGAGAASAPTTAGGVTFFEAPTVKRVKCVRRCASDRRLQGGSVMRVVGRALADVTTATFHGEAGDEDDVVAKVRRRKWRRAVLRVPRTAISGPLSLETSDEITSPETEPLDILPPPPPELLAKKGHVFPVRGPHDYGESGARFGSGRGGRDHQGQDIFARCGTPLVAARGGRVQFREYHPAGGHYIVIDGARTGADYAYMHMRSRSPFRVGDRVRTGQRIGSVGDSGNASGCHLHFEIWTAPGWYEGGRPIDPWRPLRLWDRRS